MVAMAPTDRGSTVDPALGETIAFRVTAAERERIVALARRHDRTPASEVRRAVRYYLANYPAVDRALRRAAGAAS